MSEPGYYRYPTIYGDTIVFTCEDDLWCVSVEGGVARRLTAGQGECGMAKYSPDGKRIAFIGRDEGHPEVFVIPAEGGLARRLTYMGGLTMNVCGWSADGKEILFTSESQSPFFKHNEGFAISVEGGLPHSLNLGHVQSISYGRNNRCAIGRNNNDPARWKRYRGGTAGEIWIDAAGKGEFRKLSTLSGNLVLPMWIGERVYFLSDHDGIGNLYSCKPDGSDIEQHTHQHDYFVRFPSTDGRRIVYTAGADLYMLDTVSGANQRIDVISPSGTVQVSRKFVEAKENLEHFAPHPEGHSLALIARGQPLTMGNWEGAVVQHGSGSRVRYRHAEWLSDGLRFVVLSDLQGAERLELHHLDQSAEPKSITSQDLGRARELRTSPASDMVALCNHRYELILIDVAKGKQKVLDRSPVERLGDLAWSPDGRWLAYSYGLNPSAVIVRVANVETGELHDITPPLRADYCPAWDPEGKYLYFLGARDFYPLYDSMQFDLSFPASVRPFVVPLRKDVPSPFIQKPRPIVAGKDKTASGTGANAATENGKASASKSAGSASNGKLKSAGRAKPASKGADGAKAKRIDIDFDQIQSRILGFPVNEARYGQLVAAKGRVLFTQYAIRGIKPGFNWYSEDVELGTLQAYSFEDARMAPVAKDVNYMRLAFDSQTLVFRTKERKLRAIDALAALPNEGADAPAPPAGSGRKSGLIDLGRAQTLVQPQQEWAQMFDEAWRLQRDQFWDEGMTSVDWNLVHRRYTSILKRVRTRSELSDIIWEMQGELGTSHAYEMGGDYRRYPVYYRGFLGADLVWNEKQKGYSVERIIRGDSWAEECDSPLAVPGCEVAAGEVIVAVNGRSVTRECSPDELLLNNAAREVSLTVLNKKGERRNVIVKTLRTESNLRYREWVENNRRIVHEKTKGKIGYLHIPDMGPIGFAEFHRGYLAELHRDGLIIDVRYNRGGHVSPLLLEKLARKRVGYDVSRWGVPQPYPPESVAGPMVAITNQFAGSDGDIFSHCFKLFKLGPLVGKRTWGGVIGIWPRHRLVDGTITTQPEFSFWFKDVGWKVENYGTDPDYEVDIKPQDYKAQRDPQMDRALELILQELKAKPVKLPDFSKRPSLPLPKAKAAAREPVVAGAGSKRKR